MDNSISDLRVAIMTFFMANNYGAMLQAFALQKTIENMGANCEILDYRFPYIYRRDGVYRWNELMHDSGVFKGTARYVWRHLNGWYHSVPIARKKNDSFMREELRRSKMTYYRKEALRKATYDAIVFGSDQIWSTDHTGGFASEYLGDFCDGQKTSLIAYAASCGRDCLNPEYQEAFLARLRLFSDIGVREKSLACYLREECDLPAKAVLDPVLLADPELWEDLARQGEIQIDEPYLLIYSFNAGEDIYKLALRVAKERGLKPVAICYKRQNLPDGIEQILTCGPKDFLYLLKNADFVCTTSFHGLAFSLLWEKNYYCMGFPVYFRRERDLSESAGMLDRYIEDLNELEYITDCDYTDARNKLALLQKESSLFMENALRKAAERKNERGK